MRAVAGSAAALAAVVVVATIVVSADEEASPTVPSPVVGDVAERPPVRDRATPELDAVLRAGRPFAGADPRRLPDRVDRLWLHEPVAGDEVGTDGSSGTAGDRRTLVDLAAIDDRAVAIVHAAADADTVADSGPDVRLDLVNARDGVLRWSIALEGGRAHRIVGVVGDVVMTTNPMRDRRVTAFSLRTGEELWRMGSRPDVADPAGPADRFEILEGTRLLARLPGADADETVLFDPSTGEPVGRFEGDVIATDHLGSWYVADRDTVVVHDLADGWSDGRRLDALGDTGRGELTVVGDRVLGLADEGLVVLRSDGGTDRVLSDPSGQEVAGPTIHVAGMPGSAVLLSGLGRIAGGAMDADESGRVSLGPVWERSGIVARVEHTERGSLVLVASEGGAVQEVVDGRTGRTVVGLSMTPGIFDTLRFAGNGLLVRRSSADGERTTALDIDGIEIWSLPLAPRTEVGDRLVVRVEPVEDRLVVAAYGDRTELGR